MHITNFEFKAKVKGLDMYEQKLLSLNPTFIGVDQQIDTYFNVPRGRLKLREGNIENALINYDRENTANAKKSSIILYKHEPSAALKDILIYQFGILAVVDKKRKIYFLDNIKFHFDDVRSLGTYIEVEAISDNNQFTIEQLKSQCDRFLEFFNLKEEDLVDKSYSDLLMHL